MKLYYHKTSGGAEYLTDQFVICPSGNKEGVFEAARYIIRIDGDIKQDAELTRAVPDASLNAALKLLQECVTNWDSLEFDAGEWEARARALLDAGRISPAEE